MRLFSVLGVGLCVCRACKVSDWMIVKCTRSAIKLTVCDLCRLCALRV